MFSYKVGLTSDVVYKFQCGLCDKSYCGECMRHLNVRTGISPLTRKQVNVWDTWMLELVYHHLPENKLSLRTAPQRIIYYFATTQHPMTILVF